MNFWKKISFAITLLSLFLLAIPLASHAALLPDCSPVKSNDPSDDNYSNVCGIEHLIQLLVNIYNYLLGFAAVILLLMLVWGGFQMILGFATGDPDEKYKEGKSTIVHALAGFGIVVAAYVVVNTVLIFLGVDSGSEIGSVLKGLGLLGE